MTADRRPNILLILTDDLGWSDLGCYGGEIQTPHLDALARGGVRFTQAYNSARCCPSRASLLTGLYPHQAGIGWFVGEDSGLPGHYGRLRENTVTIAEVLKAAGYGTYMTGKWHVNEPGPTERGFDEFYGYIHGYAIDSWNPGMLVRLPEGRPTRAYTPGEYFATNAITDHALDFLDSARQQPQPWLLYVGYQVPHFPLQAPLELTQKYVELYERGWDVLRDERLARIRQLGLLPDLAELPPRSPIEHMPAAERAGSATPDGRNPAWASLPAARRADLARRMAVYAAMVENMDANVGRLVAALRAHGELENTLILFMSDNGACAEWEPFGFNLDPAPFANPRPGYGIDGNTMRAPSTLHEGDALAAMGGPGSLFSYGSGWANLCNTPLWLYKHHAHEGGIRMPVVAHWPAGIPDRGGTRGQLAHIMDILPTCAALAGAKVPGPCEGRSLLPAFRNEPDPPRTLIFEHERNAAIRDGQWKLVGENILQGAGLNPDARWSLHDLATDPAEQHDLAPTHPGKVRELSDRFLVEARRTAVLPVP